MGWRSFGRLRHTAMGQQFPLCAGSMVGPPDENLVAVVQAKSLRQLGSFWASDAANTCIEHAVEVLHRRCGKAASFHVQLLLPALLLLLLPLLLLQRLSFEETGRRRQRRLLLVEEILITIGIVHECAGIGRCRHVSFSLSLSLSLSLSMETEARRMCAGKNIGHLVSRSASQLAGECARISVSQCVCGCVRLGFYAQDEDK